MIIKMLINVKAEMIDSAVGEIIPVGDISLLFPSSC